MERFLLLLVAFCKPWTWHWVILFSLPPSSIAFYLPTSWSGGAGPALSQHPGHTLAHGHYLGWGKLAEDVPAEHERSTGGERLGLGLFHQPQCHRLSYQVSRKNGQAKQSREWLQSRWEAQQSMHHCLELAALHSWSPLKSQWVEKHRRSERLLPGSKLK